VSNLFTGAEFLFALVLMLGVVITVHEFGHFAAAKLLGVRVLKFSIGFGPAIGFGRFRLAWRRGGTDYVIAWLPLGGFVRMLGDTSDAAFGESGDAAAAVEPGPLPPDALLARPAWQKLTIVFAGPLMNLLLPVAVFSASLMVGVDRAAPVVGTVELGSPAAEAGVREGDRVLAVGGEPVAWWDDVEAAVRSSPGERLTLRLERDGAPWEVALDVTGRAGLDEFRSTTDVGWLGLQHPRHRSVLGVPSADSPAARAGLRSGDQVVRVGGRPVEDWSGLAAAWAAAAARGGEIELAVERPSGQRAEAEAAAREPAETLTLRVPAAASLDALGVIPAVVLVSAVEPGSAAADAGLAAGDLMVAVDGAPIGSFTTFQETVLASEGRRLDIVVASRGETRRVAIAPRLMETDLGAGDEKLWRIGIQGDNAILPGAFSLDREPNPFVAVPRAAGLTLEITDVFLRGLHKLVVGEISRRNIGGPIEIARQSHTALQRGWESFLNLLVLISINIGILNLLPIPILDGGQALMFTVEAVKRSPLSLRTRELVQQLGLVVLVGLMGLAFWNDLSRHWSSFVEWVRGL
jgi:regulator of sigma E protease